MINRKLLLVDDDHEFLELLDEFLSKEGFNITQAYSGIEGLELLEENEFDLCVLDVMMPELNGIETLKEIQKRHPGFPVIMLTAKAEPIDKIIGLELGADDYLAKPPEPHELSARIKAILRRVDDANNNAPNQPTADISWDDNKRLFYIHNKKVVLTGIEYEVLKVLAKEIGSIVPKDEISKIALQRTLKPFDRSLDVHISNIRKKISDLNVSIKSIRGRGYQLVI